VFPSHRDAAAAIGNGQQEVPWLIGGCDDECILCAWNRRHDVAASNGL
jgi:hypothetical protein